MSDDRISVPPPHGPEGSQPSQGEQWRRQRQREDRTARVVAGFFVVAILASLALFVVYVNGGQTQLEGALLFVAFGSIGVGFALWVKVILREPPVIEERYPDREQAKPFAEVFASALGEAASGGRRRFLLRLLGGVGASLGLALLLPFASLGPSETRDFFFTQWRRGRRVVDADGNPIRYDDLTVDQVVTVFPEDHVGSADSQAVLIRLRPDRELVARAQTVEQTVCYSKICTHAGCPVGLYRARAGELLCPCHQSTFDVYHNARPLSGPTGRPLPQLPLGLDDAGFIIALGEFTEPVGPTFWNVDDEPEGPPTEGEPVETAEA